MGAGHEPGALFFPTVSAAWRSQRLPACNARHACVPRRVLLLAQGVGLKGLKYGWWGTIAILAIVVACGGVEAAERCASTLAGSAHAAARPVGDPRGLLGLRVDDDSQEAGHDAIWRKTGLTWAILEAHLSKDRCYADEIAFLQCVAAINALLNFHRDPMRLTPVTRQGSLGRIMGDAVHSAGPVDVARLRRMDGDRAELMKLQKSLRREARDVWAQQFRDGAVVDFIALYTWARHYAVQPGDEALAVGSALNAWLAANDPHAKLLPTEWLEQQRGSDGESMVGVGIQLRYLNAEWTVREAISQGPAAAAGVRSGDQITHLDGRAVVEIQPAAFVESLKGIEGTTVKLGLKRGGQALELTVRRQKVELKNVSHTLFQREGWALGYLKLEAFQSHQTYDQMKRAIQDMEKSGARGLVLDLRGNPGGEMKIAIDVASLFLGEHQVVVIQKAVHPGGQSGAYKTSFTAVTALPLVVLLDSQSASASELVAGALQDYGRATIVGQRSFGKGTVQAGRALSAAEGPLHGLPLVLFETIAKFHQPSGRTNQLAGIVPDLEIPVLPGAHPDEHAGEREEDLYAHALSSEGPAYVRRMPELALWLSSCANQGKAEREFQSRQTGSLPHDFQLLRSADILRCLVRAVEARSRKLAGAA